MFIVNTFKMYKAQGAYQIQDLTLTDFSFYVNSVHQNFINNTSLIEVIYDTRHSRNIVAQGIFSAEESITFVKNLYNHSVLLEQQSSSVNVTQTTNRDKLQARMDFGTDIVKDFLEMRLSNPTNLQEDAALSSVLMPIALSLQLGSIGLALAQISQLQPMQGLDMEFVQQKLTEIQNYLANESD